MTVGFREGHRALPGHDRPFDPKKSLPQSRRSPAISPSATEVDFVSIAALGHAMPPIARFKQSG